MTIKVINPDKVVTGLTGFFGKVNAPTCLIILPVSNRCHQKPNSGRKENQYNCEPDEPPRFFYSKTMVQSLPR
jgi:hypothetical protein